MNNKKETTVIRNEKFSNSNNSLYVGMTNIRQTQNLEPYLILQHIVSQKERLGGW